MTGENVKQYRILSLLGTGGMGEVYKAEDTRLQRPVALKFLQSGIASDPEAKARLLAEAVAASALDHPNICTVYEIGEYRDGQLFIAMPCYDGETLRQRIRRGPLAAAEAALIIAQLARALAAAHARGIVHRDIKPENLFLTRDGTVKVLDFGLATQDRPDRDSDELATSGTLAYMAPEQLRGDVAGARADIWAMGVVLFEMLTGTLPFQGYIPAALIYSILHEPAAELSLALPTVPEPLEALYRACVRQQLDERLANAAEALRILDDAPRAHSDATPARMGARRFAIPLAASAIVLLAAGLWMFWPDSGRLLARDDGRIHVAVLPFLVGADAGDSAFLAGGMQQRLIDEMEAHKEFGVAPRASIDDALREGFGGVQPTQLDSRFKALLQTVGAQYAVKGSIQRKGAARSMQVSIVNAKNNYVEFACDSLVHDDAELPLILRALAANVAGFFLVNAELRKDVSMRMWVADASQSIDAQICFLRGFQEIVNGGSGGDSMRDALAYDSTFISARVWFISSLLNKNRIAEAREQYRILRSHERFAGPAARVMIRYAGAIIENNQEAMIRNLEDALEYAPGNFVLETNLANVKYVSQGSYQEALALIRPVIEARWPYPGLYGMAARCHFSLGQFDSVWIVLERGGRARVNDLDCLAISAVLSQQASRSAAAFAEAAPAARALPLPVPLRADALREESVRFGAAFEECIRRMRQLYWRRGVSTGVALSDVASYLADYGEAGLAERYLREALEIDPGSASTLEQLGLVLKTQGRSTEARQCFARALEADPDLVTARCALGDLAWEAGDIPTAVAQYRLFLKMNVSSANADTAFARLTRAELRLLPPSK